MMQSEGIAALLQTQNTKLMKESLAFHSGAVHVSQMIQN